MGKWGFHLPLILLTHYIETMRMKIRVKPDGSVVYRLTPFYKIIYGLFCLVLIIGFFSVRGEGRLNASTLIPLLLFLISLGGAGYRESWHFNPLTGEIVYKIGFFFWNKIVLSPKAEKRRKVVSFIIISLLYNKSGSFKTTKS